MITMYCTLFQNGNIHVSTPLGCIATQTTLPQDAGLQLELNDSETFVSRT